MILTILIFFVLHTTKCLVTIALLRKYFGMHDLEVHLHTNQRQCRNTMQVCLGSIIRSLCSEFVSESWKIDLREDLVTLVTNLCMVQRDRHVLVSIQYLYPSSLLLWKSSYQITNHQTANASPCTEEMSMSQK